MLNPNERIDDLEIKNYKIIQNTEMFCYGIDAVLLSDFAKVKKHEVVLDMCTGNGVVAMLLEAKNECKHIVGIDILEKNIDMARRSIEMNGQIDKISFVCGDVKEMTRKLGNQEIREIIKTSNISGNQVNESGLVNWCPESFDVITCNPPYMANGAGPQNENMDKLVARHEIMCTLEDIISNVSKVVKFGGRMYMIHRPQRLAEIIYIMKKYDLEPKRLRNVYPTVDKKPTMILIEARKGGAPELIIEPPLITYNKEGSYTDEILRIYGKNR